MSDQKDKSQAIEEHDIERQSIECPEQGAEPEPVEGLHEDSAEAKATDQIAELREALLRSRAEMDNLEKRTQRELEKARKFMFEGVFKDLLPVIDGLDQGLEAMGEAESAAGSADEGLALTRKLLLQILERHGLVVIDPVGERFDPEWHEAMSAQPNGDVAPETILMVLQKGYRLNDRLLRPARVVIASEPS